MNRSVGILLAVLHLVVVDACFARDLLFAKVSRNYGRDGVVGQAYRREFDARMFAHANWRQRLYYDAPDGEANETIEIYVRSDDSRWLSLRRSKPALSRLIASRPLYSQRFELARELDQVHISGCEVALPRNLASELELLWKTMLPGVDEAPPPQAWVVHGPVFVGFARENASVKTGRICIAAYDTEAYRMFADIVTELKKLCDRAGRRNEAVLRTLPSKVRILTARLIR